MNSQKQNCPIGVFDSGLGGISVLKELTKLMPYEDFEFFGDSKNAPYGTKSIQEVQELSDAVTQHLLKKDIKALVIACNTATSAAVKMLRAKYPDLPIIGIEPAVKAAVDAKEQARVVVMATPLTLKGAPYQNLKQRCLPRAAKIIDVPAPKLVEFVENGELNSPAVQSYLNSLLAAYKDDVDTIVLGCTHFPFIKEALAAVIPADVAVIDGGAGVARVLKSSLEQRHLLRTIPRQGQVHFTNSKQDQNEIALSQKLFQL
ncbi:glutamate racemase [Ligilactobacillus ceti]|uniref:Glutamate racemase n=1 Tax=Ligilactobacillus ceti DSM 22408 TaxID=1122146 RepID=A0A0R2KMF6_9LACO|nr:glutamate racemase [Ligilactobacillus ceti]KRN88838.1 glutamate racemase [Ligilactobacillus ceti DSM 22408]